MKKQFTTQFNNFEQKLRLQVTVSFTTYFAIKGEVTPIRKPSQIYVCRNIPEKIGIYLPNLTPFLKWHLCNDEGTPINYIENSPFWLQSGDTARFVSTCLYGVVETDTKFDLSQPHTDNDINQFLIDRLPALQDKFKSDMAYLFSEDFNLTS